jgi:hypothetical protein
VLRTGLLRRLRAGLHRWLRARVQRRLRTRILVHRGLRSGVLQLLRAGVELQLLLCSGIQHGLQRMVSRLLVEPCRFAGLGFDRLRRFVSELVLRFVRSGIHGRLRHVCSEHLLKLQLWLRRSVRARVLDVFNMLQLHRRLRSRVHNLICPGLQHLCPSLQFVQLVRKRLLELLRRAGRNAGLVSASSAAAAMLELRGQRPGSNLCTSADVRPTEHDDAESTDSRSRCKQSTAGQHRRHGAASVVPEQQLGAGHLDVQSPGRCVDPCHARAKQRYRQERPVRSE